MVHIYIFTLLGPLSVEKNIEASCIVTTSSTNSNTANPTRPNEADATHQRRRRDDNGTRALDCDASSSSFAQPRKHRHESNRALGASRLGRAASTAAIIMSKLLKFARECLLCRTHTTRTRVQIRAALRASVDNTGLYTRVYDCSMHGVAKLSKHCNQSSPYCIDYNTVYVIGLIFAI